MTVTNRYSWLPGIFGNPLITASVILFYLVVLWVLQRSLIRKAAEVMG